MGRAGLEPATTALKVHFRFRCIALDAEIQYPRDAHRALICTECRSFGDRHGDRQRSVVGRPCHDPAGLSSFLIEHKRRRSQRRLLFFKEGNFELESSNTFRITLLKPRQSKNCLRTERVSESCATCGERPRLVDLPATKFFDWPGAAEMESVKLLWAPAKL